VTTAPAPIITLTFAGDIHFTGKTRSLLRNPASAIGPFAEQLRAADFAMVNLETAVTERGTPEPKTYHFRAPATAYQALQSAGVDLASVANNHALDYGRVGLLDTMEAAEAAGFALVGAGRHEAEAYAAQVVMIKGVRVAVLALSQIYTLAQSWAPTATRSGVAMAHDHARVAAAVRAARDRADVVVVYLHWGVEGSNCPSAGMRSLTKVLASAGATIIVGTHAHVPLGDGYLGGTYVHYGLGNFVWYTGGSDQPSSDTVLLTITLTGSTVTRAVVTPGVVGATGQPRPATGAALSRVRDRLAQAARCAGLASAPT
jgi:poly-gamma-glutamate synthesis protein (capsule biosynthesis protein)